MKTIAFLVALALATPSLALASTTDNTANTSGNVTQKVSQTYHTCFPNQ
jgi:hypothetical protein